MSEMNVNRPARQFRARHRGRGAQVGIYFGKLLRMFVYQNDWKVLPMAALIAGLVGMVIRKKFFINMEGTVMGAFAMVCVCIWNGCFNSIQVICRERDVIKREHRSGMHISSYIFSHMMYQLLLCLMQVGVTLYVTMIVGVKYPAEGFVTPWFMLDFGISMLLITYASDMLSLWVSTLAHTTTTAMTIMPFVLIFQLVFSGGMLTLPGWTKPLTYFTISNPGLKVIAAQADVNHRPYATIADLVKKMRDNEIGGTVTVGQLLDMLGNKDNPTIAEIRSRKIGKAFTVGEVRDLLNSDAMAGLRDKKLDVNVTLNSVMMLIQKSDGLKDLRDTNVGAPGVTLGSLLEKASEEKEVQAAMEQPIITFETVGDLLKALDDMGLWDQFKDVTIDAVTTVGDAVDWMAAAPETQSFKEKSLSFKTTLGDVLDLVGEEKVKTFLEEKAAEANYKPEYEYSFDNIVTYWFHLLVFILGFALLATITLEFIDKDKR